MSRHTIPRKRKLGHVIVGYDRPLREFFCQVWSRTGNMLQTWSCVGLDSLDRGVKMFHAEIPSDLYDILEAEEAGLSDTNACKDWGTGGD